MPRAGVLRKERVKPRRSGLPPEARPPPTRTRLQRRRISLRRHSGRAFIIWICSMVVGEINDLLALVDFLWVDVDHPHWIGRRETETLECCYRA